MIEAMKCLTFSDAVLQLRATGVKLALEVHEYSLEVRFAGVVRELQQVSKERCFFYKNSVDRIVKELQES